MDTVFEGLDHHNRVHFLNAKSFRGYEQMKKEVGIYDELWKAQGQKEEKGYKKGKASAQAMEVEKDSDSSAVTGATFIQLDPKDWQECILMGWCFKCRGQGKKVKGVAREHPNHPKQEETPKDKESSKKDSKKKKKPKEAAVESEDQESSDEESEAETVTGKSDEKAKK